MHSISDGTFMESGLQIAFLGRKLIHKDLNTQHYILQLLPQELSESDAGFGGYFLGLFFFFIPKKIPF